MKKPPAAPPPLDALAAYKAELETKREEMFPKVKAALEGAKGNVSHAAAEMDPPLSRNQFAGLVRKLGLVDYAADLRRQATGQSVGRPKKAEKSP